VAVNRAHIVDQQLIDALKSYPQAALDRSDLDVPVRAGFRLTGRELLELIESQFQARLLDLEARKLKARGTAYYTIASAGHEGNAAVAAALHPTDPAFLHYRSGAFFAQRAKQVRAQTPIFDTLLSLCASIDDPIAQGRHKVFGSKALAIPPQTSTIASHLPKAMGAALSVDRAAHLGIATDAAEDSIVVCSFGDASANHSTAVGAINAAQWASFQRVPMPVLFVCEDNGLGISVHTPRGWIKESYGHQKGLRYFEADGLDLVSAYEAASEAAEYVRSKRAPAFLHLDLIRMLGHAGSDVETVYRDKNLIRAVETQDPVLRSCRLAIHAGFASGAELLTIYEELRERISAAGREAETRLHLHDPVDIIAPLGPYHAEPVQIEAERADYHDARAYVFDRGLPEHDKRPRHLAVQLNRCLSDLMVKYPQTMIFGEDVAKKGGVYHVTADLWEKFGTGRVFNTLLDETSILGVAIGAAQIGFLPIPEIQYLAYFHNAGDQIRGEASSLQFFSNDQFRNPMVIRMASWGYQRGFGGHFHNDNSIAALRDIPGVIIACPTRGDDAVGMLRTCMALAAVDGRVCFFLEPIALYMAKDLHEAKDGEWLTHFPAPGQSVAFGKARVYTENNDDESEAPDLCIISFANGLWRSLRAARTLSKQHGISTHIVDLRWLLPLDEETICAEASKAGKVLVVDEGRKTGGTSEAVFTALIEGCSQGQSSFPKIKRYTGHDTFIPLGPAWEQVLPHEQGIVDAALEMLA